MFPGKQAISFTVEFLKIALISLLIILPIRYFVVQPFFVRGASMEPAFYNGDYLIVDEISYRLNAPARGDVAIFQFPDDISQYYIKRIVGLPGETIEVRDGFFYIQEVGEKEFKKISESYIDSLNTPGNLLVELQDDEVFVLGDNRMASYDSRQWGGLPLKYIVGRAWIRAWPFEAFKVIKGISYFLQ